MTRCKSFVDSMLYASMSELRGAGDSALARHVATCPHCASMARRILEDTRSLGRILEGPAPELDLNALLSRAEREAATEEPRSRGLPPSRRARRFRRRSGWVGVAAAAGISALLLVTYEKDRAPRVPPDGATGTVAARAEAPPIVEAAPGHDVAIIPTDNPDVTVVWYF